jgi:hypothetical protein
LTGLFSKAKVSSYSLLQSKVKQHATRMKEGYWSFEKDGCKSPDAFAFAKRNRALAENKIIASLSSERARADRSEMSLQVL